MFAVAGDLAAGASAGPSYGMLPSYVFLKLEPRSSWGLLGCPWVMHSHHNY